MHTSKRILLASLLIASMLILSLNMDFGAKAQQVSPFVPQVQFEEWKETLSNWGRWGPDDEIGTLNLITQAKRKEAASLVQTGITV